MFAFCFSLILTKISLCLLFWFSRCSISNFSIYYNSIHNLNLLSQLLIISKMVSDRPENSFESMIRVKIDLLIHILDHNYEYYFIHIE